MRKFCKNEYCWIKKLGLREYRVFFRPEMPNSWNKNRYEWLSSTDIENVMNQYEAAYPHFEFIGPVPIDFDSKEKDGTCIVNELCHISVKRLMQ